MRAAAMASCISSFSEESRALPTSSLRALSTLRMKFSSSCLASSRTFACLSTSANFLASLTILSTSSSESLPMLLLIVTVRFFLVPRSWAVTKRMPFASMEKTTSIWGTPLGAGGIGPSMKPPSLVLSFVNCLSPWKTTMLTFGWLSTSVVKTLDLRVGIAWLRSISAVMTPPVVSMPSVSGVTSKSTMSLKLFPPAISAKS
mmetsp:Transcript_26605/g.67581  ORF Transcript_26605/g.67581 Transcript_26605/m.67581 type:complete len:202 (-) Transcript_26605:1225-1830(-)